MSEPTRMPDTAAADRQALLDQLGTLEAALDEAIEDRESQTHINSLLAQIADTRRELRR